MTSRFAAPCVYHGVDGVGAPVCETARLGGARVCLGRRGSGAIRRPRSRRRRAKRGAARAPPDHRRAAPDDDPSTASTNTPSAERGGGARARRARLGCVPIAQYPHRVGGRDRRWSGVGVPGGSQPMCRRTDELGSMHPRRQGYGGHRLSTTPHRWHLHVVERNRVRRHEGQVAAIRATRGRPEVAGDSLGSGTFAVRLLEGPT